MKIIIIDNYDSFTYNLYQLFSILGVHVSVYRNDVISLREIGIKKPDAIVISPGPKDPSDSGISIDVVRFFGRRIPILGVCLGMQVINEVFGGRTILAPRPVHGEKDLIFHCGKGIFRSLPSPFYAARYHSLVVEVACDELEILAANKENLVMALGHKRYPITAVQFHPESFMTEYGEKIARNFIEWVSYHGSHRKDKGNTLSGSQLLETTRQNRRHFLTAKRSSTLGSSPKWK